MRWRPLAVVVPRFAALAHLLAVMASGIHQRFWSPSPRFLLLYGGVMQLQFFGQARPQYSTTVSA